jgi:hypothetical protein
MLLILHICIALSSVGYSAFVYFRPSSKRLNFSYGLIIATIATGTALVLANPAHMVQACLMGLLYTGASSVAVVSARNKLATVENK